MIRVPSADSHGGVLSQPRVGHAGEWAAPRGLRATPARRRPHADGAWVVSVALAGALVVALVIALVPALGAAQDRPPTLAAMHHTAWLQADTLPLAGARSVLRSSDGYLWLSSPRGLLRFDGVRFALLDGTTEPALRSSTPGAHVPRLVDRQGTLWMARPDGAFVTYRDGAFTEVIPMERGLGAGAEVVEDGAGTIWVYSTGAFRLARWRQGRLERVPLPTGMPDTAITRVVRDTGNGLWVGTRFDGLWHLAGGRAYAVAPPHGGRSPRQRSDEALVAHPLLHAGDGTLWAYWGGRLCCELFRIRGRDWSRVRLADTGATGIPARSAVEDAAGAVWITTNGDGLLRWHDGRLEQSSRLHGLSDASTLAVTADGEGSVWVTTDAGLDRLRPAALRTLGPADGLPPSVVIRAVTDSMGALWVEARGLGIHRLRGGALTGVATPFQGEPMRVSSGDPRAQLLTAARGGGVWVAPYDGGIARLGRGEPSRLGPPTGVPAVRVWRAVEARDGTLWAAVMRGGLGRVRHGRWAPVPLEAAVPLRVSAFVEDAGGHLWVSVEQRALLYEVVGDRVVRRIDSAAGLREPITDLVAEAGDTLWGVGEQSLIRIVGGGVASVPATPIGHLLRSEPTLVVSAGQLWIASEAGIARVPLSQLHRIADGAREPLIPSVVTALDGVSIPRTPSNTADPAWRSENGRLWFATPAGLAMAETRPLPVNRVRPEVHVEEVVVDGRALPARTTARIGPNPARVELHFTATGLRIPERVRIEHRLDGVDTHWQRARGARVATYTQLRPGRYRFRVRAWNEDGVPSRGEATLTLRVLPAWYQSEWAAGLGLAAVAGLGATGAGGVARVRRRRVEVARQATVAERVRVARELHDTILSDLAGLAMRLDAASARISPGEGCTAPPALDPTLLPALRDQARRTLDETRRAVTAMRATTGEVVPLWAQLADAARRVFGGTSVDVVVRHTGTPRPYAHALEAEALRIATEALMNARAHSGCKTVSVSCAYGRAGLELVLQDDGRGFDPARARVAAAAAGHWGLVGMAERAAALGGSLGVTSSRGRGTTVRLTMPAAGAGEAP